MNRKDRRIATKTGRKILSGEAVAPGNAALLGSADASYRSGRLDEADALCVRVLTAEPRSAPALHMRGLIAHQRGRTVDALAHLTQAVALAPSVPAVHQALAEAYRTVAQHADAERHYRRVAELQPSAVTFLNLGNALMDLQRPANAATVYEAALRYDPRLPEIYFGLGRAFAALGRGEAADVFARAIALRPDFAAAHEGLIDACFAAGASEAALRASCQALLHVDTPKLHGQFVAAVTHALPKAIVPGLREMMQRALVERWTRPHDLTRSACAIIALQQPFEASDPLLCALLELAPICHREVEGALTEQRRTLLEMVASDAALPPEALATACRLARQCYVNEYVWAMEPAECRLIHDLSSAIEAELDHGAAPSDSMIIALAMYSPLASLNGAERLLSQHRPPDVTAVLTQQIAEPAEERRLRSVIARVTSIEDQVSQAVRDQYEVNPYPRWVAMAAPVQRVQLAEWLAVRFPGAAATTLPTNRPLDVLVAGCGTGQQPLETLRRFANVRVLAIDLSLASLAYAARMTAALGMEGIDYGQADLLNAAQLGRSFDVIESGGVLHHLANPWFGWRVLISLLRPAGVMGIGLYTVRGRNEVRLAREWIAERGYAHTPEGIRQCRQDLRALQVDWAEPIASTADFSSTSSCRDLLFHVQEHEVTLPEISDFLATEGLELLGVDVPSNTERVFKAWCGGSGDDALRDLARWDLFEAQHPNCFEAMVHLWVHKPQATISA
jgi:SAM-dependent methyltransferase/Tfp pilus assembly protein PilF